jgi:hypothetical protein
MVWMSRVLDPNLILFLLSDIHIFNLILFIRVIIYWLNWYYLFFTRLPCTRSSEKVRLISTIDHSEVVAVIQSLVVNGVETVVVFNNHPIDCIAPSVAHGSLRLIKVNLFSCVLWDNQLLCTCVGLIPEVNQEDTALIWPNHIVFALLKHVVIDDFRLVCFACLGAVERVVCHLGVACHIVKARVIIEAIVAFDAVGDVPNLSFELVGAVWSGDGIDRNVGCVHALVAHAVILWVRHLRDVKLLLERWAIGRNLAMRVGEQ